MIGGIKSATFLWKSCTIPFLLNNSSTWLKMKNSDMDRLCKVHNLFLNSILNVQKAPIPLMYFDLSLLYPPYRILKEKLKLYHHVVVGLKPNALAHQIVQTQHRLKLNGLYTEVEPSLIKHEKITNMTEYSKLGCKNLVG